MRFAPGCFWSPYSRPTFLSIFPWSPLGKISENGRFRSPWQICHNSALRALMEAQFAAKCSSMIALKEPIRMIRLGCFWSPYSRSTFLSIFPWSPLGKISEKSAYIFPWSHIGKIGKLGLLGKFVITWHLEAQFAAKWSMIALQVHTN